MFNIITNPRHNPLVYLSIILIAVVAFQLSAISQNIDATIGTGGQYTIKDGSNPFLIIPQTTGNLNLYRNLILPDITAGSAMGTIFKSTSSFIHTYRGTGAAGGNIFIGINSGNFTMSAGISLEASYNTAVGNSSLNALTTGYMNSAFGVGSLSKNTTGYSNSAFGVNSLQNNISGYQNSAFGQNSLSQNSIGYNNSAFGFYSLPVNTSNNNSAFGYNSLRFNTTGYQNSAFGSGSLYTNDSGSVNSAFGFDALYYNSFGHSNCAFGGYALRSNTEGNSNSAFGLYALFDNETGNQNSAFGRNALENSTGNNNSGFGHNAGNTLASGANVTCIGANAQPSATTVSNEIVLGNSAIQYLRCQQSTISALSDARDKKDIRDLNLGIDFLMKVKPRSFNWDRREWYENKTSDGSKMERTPTAGFIAQELDEVQTAEQAEWLKLVLKNNPDRLEATPGNLLPVMVKAIQQLKTENNELKARLAQFEQVQKLLVSKIEKMESTGSQMKEVKMSENK